MSIEHEDNPSPGRALTDFELSGALLGYLLDEIPFGNMSLTLDTDKLRYTWTFGVVLPSSSETAHPVRAEHTFTIDSDTLRTERDRLNAYAFKLVEASIGAMFR
jgi:hypothetical protein|tara:strand:+ start:260 stop:571 length:312 start_codon:yes stop_codon:yes gene_type:complete